MVTMSYWPPLVAMSVVTFCRSTFSSSVTHCSWISGFFLVKSSVSFCMRIMSPLFTVAMVSVVAANADPESSPAVSTPKIIGVSFIDVLPKPKASNCFGHGQLPNILGSVSSACCIARMTHVHHRQRQNAKKLLDFRGLRQGEQGLGRKFVGDQPIDQPAPEGGADAGQFFIALG